MSGGDLVYLWLLLALPFVAGVFYLRAMAARIRAQPEFYAPQQLSHTPLGRAQIVEKEDGTKIQVYVAGEGPPVVLLHGFGMTAASWNVVGKMLLEKGHQVISVDERGHGRSTVGSEGLTAAAMADDIRVILQEMEIHRAVLVGHSMGGFLSLRFALMHPTVCKMRLKGIVLVGAFAGAVSKRNLQTRIQISFIQMGLSQWVMNKRILGWAIARPFFGRVPSPGEAEALRTLFAAQNHRVLMGILSDMVNEDHTDKLSEIQARVEVIVGSRDRATPVWKSRDIAERIEGATLTESPGSGHMLNWEDPDLVVEKIHGLFED
jgi:pimeloyl-ACP methyl ester carboxylesterase